MSNGNGHHWSKFSWRDWSADKALHPCSLAAKGFWIEMLCIMHEGCPVGHLTLGGKPATVRQMAANAYCSEKEATKHLAELEEAGVFSRTQDGTIYSRRMVKDAAASDAGREHIAKRWNGAQSTPPPNRDPNSPPTREATSSPISQPNRDPTRDPITKSLEPESEKEPEKEDRKFNQLLSNSPVLARVATACETAQAGTFGSEPDDEPSNAVQLATKNIVGKVARKLESTGAVPAGKRAKLTVVDQQDQVLYGETLPEVAHRGPVDAVRTPDEQVAEALGISLAEATAWLAANKAKLSAVA